MTFSYSCQKTAGDLLQSVTLCFNLGASATSGQIATRQMLSISNAAATLNYQLYKDATNTQPWGDQSSAGGSPIIINHTGILNILPISGNITLYARLPAAQLTQPGRYQDSYSAASAYMTFNTGLLSAPNVCGSSVGASFAFMVLANEINQCNVSANSDINFGAVNAVDTNITAKNSINVACSNGTPFTIGLSPANGSSTGAGVMRATTSSDLVNYQLRATPGMSGTVWGNSANNSQSGIGRGITVNYPIYATLPSANYAPGNYSDTVTISVAY